MNGINLGILDGVGPLPLVGSGGLEKELLSLLNLAGWAQEETKVGLGEGDAVMIPGESGLKDCQSCRPKSTGKSPHLEKPPQIENSMANSTSSPT